MAFSHVKEAIVNLDNYRRDKASYGVYDSEPVWVLGRIIKRAVEGDNPKIPASANDWQIYSDMEGSETVAQGLNRLTYKLVEAIGNCTVWEMNNDPQFQVLKKYY